MIEKIKKYLGEEADDLKSIPLQYPTAELVQIALHKLYNIDLKNFRGKVSYIQFDPDADNCEKIGDDTLKANMVKHETWDKAIKKSEETRKLRIPEIRRMGLK